MSARALEAQKDGEGASASQARGAGAENETQARAEIEAGAGAQPLGRALSRPREMLLWEFRGIVSFGQSGRFSSVAGVDLDASPAVQAVLRAAPHLSAAEAAAALLGSRSVAAEAVDRFVKLAREMKAAVGGFTPEQRWEALKKLKTAWQEPHENLGAQLGKANEEDLSVRVAACRALAETVDIKDPDLSEADCANAERLAERFAAEMGGLARGVFGAESFAFAQSVAKAPDAWPMLLAHAQKMEIEEAAQKGRLSAQARSGSPDGGEPGASQGAPGEARPLKKPRKARSL